MSKKREYPELLADIRKRPTVELSPLLDRALVAAIKNMKREVPTGTERIQDFDACPVCKRAAGESGYYCRFCGQKLRETPNAYNPYQE